MPILEISQTKIYGDQNYLKEYCNDITSQTGEDGVIEKILTILPIEKNPFCVEFGAWDGKLYSNTWNLLKNKNWNGLLIEADSNRFVQLLSEYKGYTKVKCLNHLVEFDGNNKLDNILTDAGVPRNFDLLSIDIDGTDYYIWESLTIYKPKLLVIEFNMTIPNEIIFVQDKNMQINQGCSLASLIKLGKSKGYELIATTSWNAFFVTEKYYNLFKIKDNSIDRMFDPRQYATYFFQLFDGTILLEGCKKLLWHQVDINEERIQPLPKELRKFPG